MKEIPLTQGKVALVDDDDYDSLSCHTWHVMKDHRRPIFYASTHRSRTEEGPRTIAMHRMILELEPGDKRQSDHIDGNGLNNQRSNLRIADRRQNQFNSFKPRKPSSSKYKGVCWNPRKNSWNVFLTSSRLGRRVVLTKIPEEWIAAEVYNIIAPYHQGEFARLNTV